MSEENISLFDLLNLAIGTPQKGAVNFSALHALLNAVLRQLDIREVKTEWRDTSPGDGRPDAPVGVPAHIQEDRHTEQVELRAQTDSSTVDQEVQPGNELQERTASPGPAAGGQGRLLSRIQTCEDGVSKAMKIIQELHNHTDDLKEETKELRLQQTVAAQAETVSDVEKCCHRVDALQETVRSLRDTLQKFPDPQELSRCVSWDVMQSALLSHREHLQEELVHSGIVDPAKEFRPTHTPVHSSTPSPPHPVGDNGRPAAPSPPANSPQIPADPRAGTEAPLAPSEPPWQTDPEAVLKAAATLLPRKASGSERHAETVEALRNIDKLKESFSDLEARVAALEEGSGDALNNPMDQLNQQRALIDSLMRDRDKLDSLEDMFLSVTSGDRDSSSEAASGSEDSKASHELTQQMSYLRKCLQKLEEELKQLKATQASAVERTAEQHLQDQLDDLRGMLEDMMQSLTSDLSEAGQDEGDDDDDSQSLAQRTERATFTSSTVNVGWKLSLLFQHYEQLQDTVNSLLQQQTAGRAEPLKVIENVELVNDVQKAILQLQAGCEKLHETSRQKQRHIEELYKTTEELEESKADKQMVESEIKKADKSALDSKVSRLQFDSATEQLGTMFHELLNKVTGQEQDWHNVIRRLSTEMECKLNRMELDSVKKQLEDRWRNIHEKLQAQGAPEQDDAAGIRKQLVDRFHCLSCDRPVVMHSGQHVVKLSSTAGFPSHKSIRPFTVYALEQFRQHYRSLKPGTRRYSLEVDNCGRRRQQLQRSHAVMCRQIESVQRRHADSKAKPLRHHGRQPGKSYSELFMDC
ncbi:glutamine-rich protein 2 [Cottoperca gobio]|uniref:Glutamine-rich protein 2 n=1 Tax=Cottoperca gobio TaxID=56716 RepID=A0A6J2PBT2_COTGO|nr:glutamine-rich protein 2-like [Cottoperca gobio]